MKTLNCYFKVILLFFAIYGISSCSVTNNMYLNNPEPLGKNKGELYLGLGTGIQAKVDSVSSNGDIHFSDKISTSPNLLLGGQGGLSKRDNMRIAFHFPKIIGGIGLRMGYQHSFTDSGSRFNMAVGTDLGGVFAKDSIQIFGSKSAVGKETDGALNADFFIPVSFKTKNFMLIVTPRYSFNTLFIRENQFNEKDWQFGFSYPALTLGLRVKKLYLETTAMKYNNKIYPHFGIAWKLL